MNKNTTPKIAVVLGSIGVRAAAAIPLFEFMDEAGIEPDFLIGSSGAGLLAAMRGAGFSTREMRDQVGGMIGAKIYSSIDYRTLLGFAHSKLGRPGIGSAIKKNHHQLDLFRRIFGDRQLEDLEPSILLQTADCLAGESVILESGPLAEAVYAAGAMAPEFPPVRIDGRWLVDGSYVAPVPILEAVKRGADIIIAFFHPENPKPHPADLLECNYNILAAYFSRLIRDQTMLSIELHHHEIILVPVDFDQYVGPWETKAIPRVLQAGERAVAARKAEILDVISNTKD
ncbi:MAG: patatin-like phospholipase family protein [Acidobacteriota bacterium]|nr:MAG: patatin-like phospholipase family protein [Acidobacteriota bacterium]